MLVGSGEGLAYGLFEAAPDTARGHGRHPSLYHTPGSRSEYLAPPGATLCSPSPRVRLNGPSEMKGLECSLSLSPFRGSVTGTFETGDGGGTGGYQV